MAGVIESHLHAAIHHVILNIKLITPWLCSMYITHLFSLCFSVGFLFNTVFSVAFGIPGDPKAAAEGEKLLSASLATIESFWLQGDGPFLLGNPKPTIADLALVCEVTQLEVSKENLLSLLWSLVESTNWSPKYTLAVIFTSVCNIFQECMTLGNTNRPLVLSNMYIYYYRNPLIFQHMAMWKMGKVVQNGRSTVTHRKINRLMQYNVNVGYNYPYILMFFEQNQ